jgi:hypothetical protein
MPRVLDRKKQNPTVVEEYDVAADAKKRIRLRRPKTKYFRVRALSNGAYLLEPRVLVSPHALSARVLKMLDQSAENLKKGLASPPIDLTPFRHPDDKTGSYARIKLSGFPSAKPKTVHSKPKSKS